MVDDVPFFGFMVVKATLMVVKDNNGVLFVDEELVAKLAIVGDAKLFFHHTEGENVGDTIGEISYISEARDGTTKTCFHSSTIGNYGHDCGGFMDVSEQFWVAEDMVGAMAIQQDPPLVNFLFCTG